MARDSQLDKIQQLKALGITGSDEAMIGLLKAADFNLERAVNHYFDRGAPTLLPAPRSSNTTARKKDVAIVSLDDDNDEDDASPMLEGPVEVMEMRKRSTASAVPALLRPPSSSSASASASSSSPPLSKNQGAGGPVLCHHRQGPDCLQCAELSPSRRSLPPTETWPKVLGQRILEQAYCVSKDKAVVAGEEVIISLESGIAMTAKHGGQSMTSKAGGKGGSNKRKGGFASSSSSGENKTAAAIRFRTEHGVEGRLPSDIAAVLYPLMVHKLIQVEAKACMTVARVQYFTKLAIRLRVSVMKGFFAIGEAPEKGAAGTSSSAILPLAEAVISLLAFLSTGKVEMPVLDQDNKKQRMMTAASSNDIKGEGKGEEEEDEEGPAVSENQLQRLYRLNEEHYQGLPEYVGPVTNLRGLELRPYQRQALQWMLQREKIDDDSLRLLEGEKEGKDEGWGGGGMHLELGSAASSMTGSEDRKEEEEAAVIVDKKPVWLGEGLIRVSKNVAKQQLVHHPLWDRHFVATVVTKVKEGRGEGEGMKEEVVIDPLAFYSNPYSKKVRLAVPPPPKECRGGILADDMGMGKTIMLLSLILEARARRSRSNKSTFQAPTLVVVPLSVLSQWYKEIEDFSARNALSVAIYYGTDRVTSKGFLSTMDVVLTTYGTLQSEFQAQRSILTTSSSSAPSSSSSLFASSCSSMKASGNSRKTGLFAVEWERLVLDEAHNIKNRSTDTYRAAYHLQSTCRWAVTGTPIQNALGDVFTLLRFLRHEPWDDPVWWKKIIEEPFGTGDEGALDRLRNVLAPILLRRRKDSKGKDGKPIVQLPERKVQLIEVEFSEAERAFYDNLRQRSKVEFEDYVRAGTASQSYAQILHLLLRLRQACDHPFLVLGRALEESKGGGGDVMQEEGLIEVEEGGSGAVVDLAKRPLASSSSGQPQQQQGGGGGGRGKKGSSSSVTPDFIKKLFARFSRQQQKEKAGEAGEGGVASSSSFSSASSSSSSSSSSSAAGGVVAMEEDEKDQEGGKEGQEGKGGENEEDLLNGGSAYFNSIATQLQTENGLQSSECPICLACPPEDPVITPCCHIMCRVCLQESIDYPNSGSQNQQKGPSACAECPVCRANIAEADLMRITDENSRDAMDGMMIMQRLAAGGGAGGVKVMGSPPPPPVLPAAEAEAEGMMMMQSSLASGGAAGGGSVKMMGSSSPPPSLPPILDIDEDSQDTLPPPLPAAPQAAAQEQKAEGGGAAEAHVPEKRRRGRPRKEVVTKKMKSNDEEEVWEEEDGQNQGAEGEGGAEALAEGKRRRGRPRKMKEVAIMIEESDEEEEEWKDDDDSSDNHGSDEEVVKKVRSSGRGRGRKGKVGVKKNDEEKEEEEEVPPAAAAAAAAPLALVRPSLIDQIEGDDVIRGSTKLKRLMDELERLVFNAPPDEDDEDDEKEGHQQIELVGSDDDEAGGNRKKSATAAKKKKKKKPPIKAVIFSQWTFMLDLIQRAIKGRKWGYTRLDGATTQAKRQIALADFAQRDDIRIMILSLRAGGVGLNLTSASVVFMMDPWWNPAVEEQAIDRVHRLGQRRKEVTIMRFVVRDTVEQQMLEIQEKKRRVAQNALACFGDRQDEGRLNLDELRRFFH